MSVARVEAERSAICRAIDAYVASHPNEADRAVRFRNGFLTAIQLYVTSRVHDRLSLSDNLLQMAVDRIEVAA